MLIWQPCLRWRSHPLHWNVWLHSLQLSWNLRSRPGTGLTLGRVPDDTSNFQIEVAEQREEAEEALLDIHSKKSLRWVCSGFQAHYSRPGWGVVFGMLYTSFCLIKPPAVVNTMRTAQMLASASMQQCEQRVAADIEKMSAWVERAQDHANRQVSCPNSLEPRFRTMCLFDTTSCWA